MKFKIQRSKERIQSKGGIALFGEILDNIGFANRSVAIAGKYRNTLTACVGMLAQGCTAFEDIEAVRGNRFFEEALGLYTVPSAVTVRRYLEHLVSERGTVDEHIRDSVRALLKREQISGEKINGVKCILVPVDVDTSPLDNSGSHKEGVSCTYKKVDGYHPIFAYIGTEGYMLGCELREGKQHCQKGTPAFLEQVTADAQTLVGDQKIVYRLDGGFDSADTLRVLEDSGQYYIVRHNLRTENRDHWPETARTKGQIVYTDRMETRYVGVLSERNPKFPEMDLVFDVTVHHHSETGQAYMIPPVEVRTWWTNLPESPKAVIELYRRHGTSEQFHSELKSDMNVERLPSGKFAVNGLILKLSMLAFDILRCIGQRVLTLGDTILPYKLNIRRRRLRKVIDDIIRIAVKVVRHGRQTILNIWEGEPWGRCFEELYETFCHL